MADEPKLDRPRPVIPEAVRNALRESFPSLIEDEISDLDKKMPLAGGLNRDDAKLVLELIQRKLIETEIDIRKKGIAVGHEFISDIPSFAFAGAALPGYIIAFSTALDHLSHDVHYFAASAAGLVLLNQFTSKELQVLKEFSQVYAIWSPYIKARAEANKIRIEALSISDEDQQFEALRQAISLKDNGLAELKRKFKASGLLFEGIKIPENYASRLTNGFYFDGDKVHEIARQVNENISARQTKLKEIGFRIRLVREFVMQHPADILRQSWDKAVHVAWDVWDNTLKTPLTMKRVWSGKRYLIKPPIDCKHYLAELQKDSGDLLTNENYRNAKLDLISHLKDAQDDRRTYFLASVFGAAHSALLGMEIAALGHLGAKSLIFSAQGAGSNDISTAMALLGSAMVSYFSIMIFSEPLRQTVDNLEKNLAPDGVLSGKVAHYIKVKEGLLNPPDDPPQPL